MNRSNGTLDIALSLMVAGLFGALGIVLLAWIFMAGFALGKVIAWLLWA
jgi:hypothetical protein